MLSLQSGMFVYSEGLVERIASSQPRRFFGPNAGPMGEPQNDEFFSLQGQI